MLVLVRMLEDAGCTDVRTYIQSGNAVFEADARCAAGLAAELTKAIAKKLDLRIPVILRSATELQAVARRHPFLQTAKSTDFLHVIFLADRPTAARVAALDPNRSPPDTFQVQGREIYVHCPQGAGRTKLTNAWFDTTLATVSTMRNWKTVLALADMTRR
jgi:uncharacterized protein (DUF1697 family)